VLLLAYADAQCTSAVKTEVPEVVPLYMGQLTTVVLFFVYIDKKADHVRIYNYIYTHDLSVCICLTDPVSMFD